MAFSAKPVFFPRFAINDVTDGGGRVNVTEPPTDKKNSGWEYLEKPARDYMNWIHRGNYLWIDYFNQFWNSSHQFVINEMTSESGNGIDILQPLGIKTVPVSGTNLHVNQADSAASIQRFTNSTTGATATDGFEIGLDASEQGRIWNYENTDLVIGTNNAERMRIMATGEGDYKSTLRISGSQTFVAGSGVEILYAANVGYIFGYDRTTPGYKKLILGSSTLLQLDSAVGVGIGVTPSNPLHVQSTTTPQVRIAYDADSYATLSVADGSNLTIACAESGSIILSEFTIVGNINSASRPITISPGTVFSWNYSGGFGENDIWNNSTTAIVSFSFKQMTGASAHTDLMTIAPNGTLYILGTTECTGADTGALQVDGGAHFAGNNWIGGYYRSSKGRWPTGSISGNVVTQNTVFDAMNSAIPNTNDGMLVTGMILRKVGGSNHFNYTVRSAQRLNSTTIRIYCGYMAVDLVSPGIAYSSSSLDMVDGSATTMDVVDLSW
jgi:hypothetical protein